MQPQEKKNAWEKVIHFSIAVLVALMLVSFTKFYAQYILAFFDWGRSIAKLMSLALTPPTIVMAIYVVKIWGKAAWDLRLKALRDWTPTEWFIIGVMCTFLGSAVDNLYWGVAWSCDYLQWESAATWFQNGVYSNVPFRQLTGIIAGYCHVRSAIAHMQASNVRRLTLVTYISFLAGSVAALLLLVTR